MRSPIYLRLLEILAQVSLISIGNKACRDEYPDFLNNNAQAAGKNLRNLGCEDFFVLVGFLDTLVAAVCSKALVGKNHLSVSVVYFQNLNFKFVAYVQDFCEINRVIIRVLSTGKDTVGLGADVQDGLIGFYVDDLSLYYLSGVNGSMIFFGVDAPAVMPITFSAPVRVRCKSFHVCMKKVFGHSFLQIS